MTGFKTYFEEHDVKFDSAYAPPPRRVLSLGRVLVGATVVIVGLGISTIAIHNYSWNALSSAIHAEQLTGVVLDIGERIRRRYDCSQMAQNNASVSNRSTIQEISDLLDQQLQSPGKHADPTIGDVAQNCRVSVEPSHVDQEATQGPGLLEAGIAAAPQRTGIQNITDLTELAAIAPESGLALPEEIVAKESPLSAAPSPAKNQLAIADNAAWRIQLISLNSQTNAETAWTRLQQANPDLLDNLTLHVQSARLSNGTFYRVQAGPLADRATATTLCESLKSRKQDCLMVAP